MRAASGPVHSTTAPARGWRRLWEGWKRIARRIGDVQARIMLTVFYFLILTPFALAVRALSDPMRFGAQPAWLPKEVTDIDAVTHARRQY
jgi:hypothetical protein